MTGNEIAKEIKSANGCVPSSLSISRPISRKKPTLPSVVDQTMRRCLRVKIRIRQGNDRRGKRKNQPLCGIIEVMMFSRRVHPLQKRSRTHRAVCLATDTCKDHFVPHEGNDHTPHALSHRALIGYATLLVALKIFLIVATFVLPVHVLFSAAVTAENIIALTNQTRISLGLPPLKADSRLSNAARMKAADMSAHEYFAHTSPQGITPWVWFAKAGYQYQIAGENLAVHFTSAEAVQAGWMASPSHKANIVDARYEHIGVGVVEGMFDNYNTLFVVQMFGKPKVEEAVPVAPAVVTPSEPEANPVPVEEPVQEAPLVLVEEQEVEPEPEVEKKAVYDPADAVVSPRHNGYAVEVPVKHADQVSIQVAGEEVYLEPGEADVWKGEVYFNEVTVQEDGEEVTLNVRGEDGEETSALLALLSPAGTVKAAYLFNTPPEKQFFGIIGLTELISIAQYMYIGVITFIVLILSVALLLWSDKQKHTIVAHSVGILLLALAIAFV